MKTVNKNKLLSLVTLVIVTSMSLFVIVETGAAVIDYDFKKNGLLIVQAGQSDEVLETTAMLQAELPEDIPTKLVVADTPGKLARTLKANRHQQVNVIGHGSPEGLSAGGETVVWSELANEINQRTDFIYITSCYSFGVVQAMITSGNEVNRYKTIAPFSVPVDTEVAAKVAALGYYKTHGNAEKDRELSSEIFSFPLLYYLWKPRVTLDDWVWMSPNLGQDYATCYPYVTNRINVLYETAVNLAWTCFELAMLTLLFWEHPLHLAFILLEKAFNVYNSLLTLNYWNNLRSSGKLGGYLWDFHHYKSQVRGYTIVVDIIGIEILGVRETWTIDEIKLDARPSGYNKWALVQKTDHLFANIDVGGVFTLLGVQATSWTTLSYGTYGGGGCVEEHTLITMADRTTKKARDIEVGDLVLGYDTELGVTVPVKVTSNIEAPVEEIIVLTTENHDKVRVTPEDQPIYIRDGTFTGWVNNPDSLSPGCEMYQVETGQWVKIVDIDRKHGNYDTYHINTQAPAPYSAAVNTFIGDGFLMDPAQK